MKRGAVHRLKYPTLYDGEWIKPRMRDWLAVCCDCGLVHRFTFRIRKGRLSLMVMRDNRKTAAHRRERKKRGEMIELRKV